LLSAYRKNSTYFQAVTSITFTNIPIPIYDVSNNDPIFQPFPNLKQITLLRARLSIALGDKFFGGASNLTSVILRDCELREFPLKAIQKLPKLFFLDLSYNYIEFFNASISNHLCNLHQLDISHNFIRYIESGAISKLVNKGLKILDLSNNFISDFGPKIIDQNTLSQMKYLDLRKNMPSCDCTFKDNFGWLINSKNKKLKLPGFLPICTDVVNDYYGGCLTCTAEITSHPRSLFLYSLNDICDEHFAIALTASFTSFLIVLQTLSLIYNSNYFRDQLAKSWSQNILSQIITTDPHDPEIYAYDGFVYYDKEDLTIGNWVDKILVPELQNGKPSFIIGVTGKEEWCGETQVKQLLLKIQASRKTIILLNEKFLLSSQCRYVLSVLEDIHYRQGEDKCIIINLQKSILAGKAIQIRLRRNPRSVLNLPELNAANSLFWEMLKAAIVSRQSHK